MNRSQFSNMGAAHLSREQIAGEQRRFLVKVYNWMGSGLCITGLVAWYVAHTPSIMATLVGNPMIFFALIIVEFGAVFYLASSVMKMSAQRAMAIFLGYSALNGVTFSVILIVYPSDVITKAFVVTALTFGAMSLYGATTRKDLSSWGSFLFMGLIGVVIASVVNIFMQSQMMDFIITYVGVLVFVGLTAYDTQMILRMNIIGNEGTDEDTKEAISGALRLYLDFINLFLMMLRVMGGSRN